MAGTTSQTIAVENVNHPGRSRRVTAAMYAAMKRAMLKVLPAKPPGLTFAELGERVLPLLPEELFPEGARANWWAKTVQLDLEAKGLIERGSSSPLRLHRTAR
jgi:hypothetical protein